MKKKWFLFVSIVLVLSVLTGIAAFRSAAGRKPFASLAPDEIASATVEVLPPDKSARLDGEAIGRLVNILRATTIYRKDDSYREYAGQAVVFTITKTDGSTFSVMAYNPFLVIDGTGYRTKYEPCQALNALGNELIE